MIVVRLRGGLGNQLFQYAAGKGLAEYHRTELKLDRYTYSKHPYRKYELNKFNVDDVEATRAEVHKFTGSNPLTRYLNKRENYFRSPKVFAQPHYHFYEGFFDLPSHIYLSGYWQSEKYFSRIMDIVRSQFTGSKDLDSRNSELQSRLRSENSVSIHVRRGDYGSSSYSSFFGTLAIEYYMKSIEEIQSMVDQPRFYFFSDNPAWCRETFSNLQAEFIDYNQGADSYKDLLLMASCKHNIIANSTFSWWGAWLNTNPDKKVIAPRDWFRTNFLDRKAPVYASRFYNTKDLIPETWKKL